MNRYYFAYGSNLNSRQMSSRCPTARKAGTYLLKGYELEFRCYLTIKPSPGKVVPIGVFAISEDDERRLDRYEGYPIHYRKQTLEIEKDGEFRIYWKLKTDKLGRTILPHLKQFMKEENLSFKISAKDQDSDASVTVKDTDEKGRVFYIDVDLK